MKIDIIIYALLDTDVQICFIPKSSVKSGIPPWYVGSDKLKGYRVLITGGTSGIGRAVAIAYAREGADVAIPYLPSENDSAQEVISLIRAEGRKAYAIPGDIRQESFCEVLVARAVSLLGGLDVLVNSACRQQFNRSIRTLKTSDFDSTFKTNVYAMFWITKAALNHIPAGGSIINSSCALAFKPSDSLLDYSQTKAAVIAFTKSLAQQLGSEKIRVNAVSTGLLRAVSRPYAETSAENVNPNSVSGSPKYIDKRVEMESLYVTLASRGGSFISGQVWCTEGGTDM